MALLVGVLFASLPATAGADISVALSAFKDCTVVGTPSFTDALQTDCKSSLLGAGTVGTSAGSNSSFRHRSIIAFDVSPIPTTATVTGAILRLYMIRGNTSDTSGATVQIYRVGNYSWVESVNNGWPIASNPADPTFCYASYSAVSWGCGVGYDRYSQAQTGGILSTDPCAASGGSCPSRYVWSSSTMTDDVQQWVNQSHTNAGWLLYNTSEGSSGVMRHFGSRESTFPPELDVTYKLAQGSSCGNNADCATGFCTNGVCCNVAACPAAQACNSAPPVCQSGSGVCSNPLSPSGTVCRASAGACDPAETCNGTSNTCPADTKSTAVCRASAGVCDPAESCDGVHNDCPADAKSTAVCRPSAGACDTAESCDGVSNACPADAKSTAVCRPSAGVCDTAESCDGTSNTCPADAKSTAVCRPSVGVCDVAESCDGSSNTCPADAKSTAVCRPSVGACDLADSCDGTSNTCPADAKSTAVCRPSAGACDIAESCDGVTNTCPADTKSTAVCRPSAGVCDTAESCDGISNTCPADAKVAANTPCADDGNPCSLDQCNGTSALCQHPAGNAGATCRASTGVCDPAETCTGSSTTCPSDAKRTAVCRPSAGVCDPAESCDGVSGACPADAKSTSVCRPATGVCDAAESCDGTSNTCPPDGFLPSTTQCRAQSCASGTETLSANCTGTSASCPAVVTQSCSPFTCKGTSCGGNCAVDGDCATGHCVDGVCCNTACGNGDPTDCQACNVPGKLGTCSAEPNTYVCRAAAGVCDAADLCDGTATACPADAKLPASTVCRASAGPCDKDDHCDGTSNGCTADAKQPASFVCRPSAGPCDVADNCDGTSNACTSDVKEPNTFVCRPSAGPCDVADKCDGTNNACTTDAKTTAGTSCPDDGNVCTTDQCDGASAACQHPAGNAGTACRVANGSPCDVADFCDGTSTTCADAKAPTSTVCRPAAGECDATDFCDGADDACPTDAKVKSGTTCSDDGNVCTRDQCNGASNLCQHPAGNAGTTCRAANGSPCDVADVCDGASTTCPDAKQPSTFVCRPAAGVCDVADTCDGTHDACPADVKATAGTTCPDDGLPCTTDTCDGSSATCQHPAGNAGVVCRVASGGVCDAAEKCDGAHTACPADGFLPPSTQCHAPTCTNGVETLPSNCTGTSATCPAAATQSCGQFVCGSTACLTKCAADTDCTQGDFCTASGTCTPKGDPGAPCTGNDQCTTAFCVDGVCCKDDCSGQCEACNLPGSIGTCSAVTGAPVGNRPDCPGDGTACTGTCNGINTQSCSLPGSSVQCRSASCANGVATLAEFCTGTGSCPAARTQDCGDQVCGPTKCEGCSTDGECGAGKFCRGGVCNPLGTSGGSCSRDGECRSGHCVDGVCCNSDCIGQCEACNVPGSAGECVPVTGVPVGNRPACNGANSPCGGTCDGVNGRTCTYPGFGTVCHAGACTNGVATLPSFCDGAGSCPAAQQVPCPADATCVGDACSGGANTCTDTCSIGAYCAGGVCVPQKGNGAACNTGSECASSFCIDGVCCNEACSGQCQACDVAGNAGTCLPVVGAPHGSRQGCASDGSSCAGSCDGRTADRCGYPDNNTSCRTASCVDGIATLGSGCQGDGSCGPLLQQVCGPDGCDIGNVLCAKGCRADVDCTDPGQFCSGGVCVPKLGNGSACDAPSQCSTENCVDHFCCDTACNGQCESCNQAGAVGTCQAVVGVPRGSRPACPGAGACGGFCDGTSRTECALPGSSTTCGVPFCDNGATTGAPACANTVCVPPAPESCDPFACDPAGQECLTSCTRDEDCAPGLVCSNDGCVAKVTSGPDAGSDAGTDASTDASIGAGGAGGRAATDASIDGPRGTGGGAGRGGVSSGTGGSTSTDGGGIDGGAPKKGERGGATSDKGSCGCRVPGSGSSGGNAPLAVISVSLLLGLRRRRAPRLRPLA